MQNYLALMATGSTVDPGFFYVNDEDLLDIVQNLPGVDDAGEILQSLTEHHTCALLMSVDLPIVIQEFGPDSESVIEFRQIYAAMCVQAALDAVRLPPLD